MSLPHDWVTGKSFDAQASPNHGYKSGGPDGTGSNSGFREDRNQQIFWNLKPEQQSIYLYKRYAEQNGSYGYNSFCVDITGYGLLRPAVNLLAVRIEATPGRAGGMRGQESTGMSGWSKKKPGSYRLPGVYVKSEQQADGTWKLDVETEVENSFGQEREMKLEAVLYLDGNKKQELPV